MRREDTNEFKLILVRFRSESENLRIVIKLHRRHCSREIPHRSERFPLRSLFRNDRALIVDVDDSG